MIILFLAAHKAGEAGARFLSGVSRAKLMVVAGLEESSDMKRATPPQIVDLPSDSHIL